MNDSDYNYTRLCQVMLLNADTKCLTHLQFSEPAMTDVATPKERLLSGRHGDTYSCATCFGKHEFKDALFAKQQDLFWDKEEHPQAPMSFFKPNGEDEFIIKSVVQNGYLKVDHTDDGITIKEYHPRTYFEIKDSQ